jgi:hypothetical protein
MIPPLRCFALDCHEEIDISFPCVVAIQYNLDSLNPHCIIMKICAYLSLLLSLALLTACNLPQEAPIQFERPEILQFIKPAGTALPPGVTPPPPERVDFVDSLVAAVSSQNLFLSVEALAGVHSRHVNSASIQQAAELIFSGFQSAGGRLNVAYDEFELEYDEIASNQRNVIARLPGSDPSAGVIVIGAHYDARVEDISDAVARAPGADDNASGVAALMEMARLLANETPVASIDFVAFAAEEIGTAGSSYYLQSALSRGEIIRGVIILDIIGNAGGAAGRGTLRAFSASPDTSISRQLARWVSGVALVYTPGFQVRVESRLDRPGRFSDHLPFTQAGIPAIRLIELVEDASRQHTSNDLPQYLDQDYLRQATQLALAAVVNLAFGFELPPPP